MPGPGTTGRVCLCRLAALRLVDHEPVSEYKTARVADEMSVDARRCGHPYVVLGDTCLTGFVLCHTVFRWATSGWALCILVFIAVQILYSHVRSPACLVRRIL